MHDAPAAAIADTPPALVDPSTAITDPLLAYRSQFPILAHTTYLISNSLGAVPEAAYAEATAYVDIWAKRGVRAWEEAWWSMLGDLGDLAAPLIGAGPGEVIFQPNVTLAHAAFFSAFDFQTGPRRKIVTDAMHFPSILYLIQEQAAYGAQIVVVPSDDGVGVELDRLLAAIDEDTAFVNLSHVYFRSAYIQDVAAVAARAREVGALSIIDGYQSVGTIPVDVRALGVDIYIGGCLKWLCGGPGVAFSWIRPELASSLRPRLTGWMAHEHPFDFAPTLERRTNAWRFLTGTPNVPAFYVARPGLRILGEVGLTAIREKSMRQTARLVRLAGDHDWACRAPIDPARRGGTVAIDLPNGLAISQALKAREILCDFRPGAGIRLSPHFYTDDAELDVAVEAIADILKAGDWRQYASASPTVT